MAFHGHQQQYMLYATVVVQVLHCARRCVIGAGGWFSNYRDCKVKRGSSSRAEVSSTANRSETSTFALRHGSHVAGS